MEKLLSLLKKNQRKETQKTLRGEGLVIMAKNMLIFLFFAQRVQLEEGSVDMILSGCWFKTAFLGKRGGKIKKELEGERGIGEKREGRIREGWPLSDC